MTMGMNAAKAVGMFDCRLAGAIARSGMIGPRVQSEDINASIARHSIKPVVGERVYWYEQARLTHDHMVEQNVVGKTVIRVADQ